jgi:hypothetical protein
MDDERSLLNRMMEMTESAMAKMQAEVSQMSQRAQQTARQGLNFATSEDVARLQAQLDRIEAAMNDVVRRQGGGSGTTPGDAAPGGATGGMTETPPASAVPPEGSET